MSSPKPKKKKPSTTTKPAPFVHSPDKLYIPLAETPTTPNHIICIYTRQHFRKIIHNAFSSGIRALTPDASTQSWRIAAPNSNMLIYVGGVDHLHNTIFRALTDVVQEFTLPHNAPIAAYSIQRYPLSSSLLMPAPITVVTNNDSPTRNPDEEDEDDLLNFFGNMLCTSHYVSPDSIQFHLSIENHYGTRYIRSYQGFDLRDIRHSYAGFRNLLQLFEDVSRCDPLMSPSEDRQFYLANPYNLAATHTDNEQEAVIQPWKDFNCRHTLTFAPPLTPLTAPAEPPPQPPSRPRPQPSVLRVESINQDTGSVRIATVEHDVESMNEFAQRTTDDPTPDSPPPASETGVSPVSAAPNLEEPRYELSLDLGYHFDPSARNTRREEPRSS